MSRSALLITTTLLSFVPAAAFAVQAHDSHRLEIGRRSVELVRTGVPSNPAVKAGDGRRVFAPSAAIARSPFGLASPAPRAAPSIADVDRLSRDVVRDDRNFFRIPSTELGRFRTRSFLDRTWVDYAQTYRGLEVVDSGVTLIYQDGKLVLSTAVTFDDIALDTTPAIDARAAETLAADTLAADGAIVSGVEAPAELVVYPQEIEGAHVYRLGFRTVVRTSEPIGRFRTIVAADGSGAVLFRRNLIAFDAAQILIEVEPRTIGDTPAAVAAKGLRIDASTTADFDGIFEAPGADVTVTARGPFFVVNNQAANERTKTFAAGTFSQTWDSTEAALEEVDSFYHSNVVRERQLRYSPDIGIVNDTGFPVNVNVGGTCNAYYDGQSINFFPSGGGCNSTARIADVVYHEYGHGIHDSLTGGGGQMQAEIQEGVADYFAHTITEDPNMGPYFFPNNIDGIRNAEEVRTYPSGVQGDNSQVHESGKIWTNTFWELRKKMIAKHGEQLGIFYTDLLHTNTLRGNPRYTTSYMMALAADDDDGNLSNGTPNACEITEEFQAHGLVATAQPTRGFLALSHTPASSFFADADAPVAVTVSIASLSPSCGGLDASSVKVHYRVDGGTEQTVTLTGSGTTFAGEIPAQAKGANVEYWFSAQEDARGATFTGPLFAPFNAYRYHVGPLNTVFLDEFESESGWTHGGATLASHDDWERGTPAGLGLDPADAFSGSSVWGNDLGLRAGNGATEFGAASWLESPAIDCSECVGTRLQFRRWISADAGDGAKVLVNGTVVWDSADYAAQQIVIDRHWELVDIAIDTLVDGKSDVKVRFEIGNNGTLAWGGWAIDDVALRAEEGGVPPGETPPPPGVMNGASLNGGCTCTLSGTTANPRSTLLGSLLAGLALMVRLRRRR